MSYTSYGSSSEISKSSLFLSVGLINAVAIAATGAVAWMARGLTLNWIAMIIIFLFILAGAVINGMSQTATSAVGGFAMAAIGYGILLGPVVTQYGVAAIWQALVFAVLVVGALGAIGAVVIKDDKRAWGPKLSGALLFGIIAWVGIALIGMLGGPTAFVISFWHIAMTLVFVGLTIWDFNQLVHDDDRSFANTIRYSFSIYLDIMWFFLQFLGASRD